LTKCFILDKTANRKFAVMRPGGETMIKKSLATAVILLTPSSFFAQSSDKSPVLENAAKAMGATGMRSIQYSGSGYNFALGQSVRPFTPWPRFNVKSYTRVINYDTASSREEMIRTQFENPPRGGGQQPIVGEQRQVQLVSGAYSWNLAGGNPAAAPAASTERMLQIWLTPHGFLKAALAHKATVSRSGARGKAYTVSFMVDGRFNMRGLINDRGLLEEAETWIANPVMGDMKVEAVYANYQDFGGVKFPKRIILLQGGYPTLDITVSDVRANAAADIQAPDNVRQATAPPVRVESEKVADGVWYITGGSHHSVAVEFKDHFAVIDAPLNEDRSLAVIEEVKRLVPNKPIRYLVITHHHFDHFGGARTYVAEGATVVTHLLNRKFCEQVLRGARRLSPDKLSQTRRPLRLLSMGSKRVLTDGTRVLELHHVLGNGHNDAIIMGYLPKERLLIEADVFTPPAPNAAPPATPNPFTVNLYENIQRLRLEVDQIAPMHGRLVKLGDLRKAIGR
jgi:glyoxylase-like metal-dependent hydrolase (beta-lactamase superfamily II)